MANMDFITFRNIYWNYYLQMEKDFFSYSPYCEIDECNRNAFSLKYLQLLLSVCGEIDSICKTFCKDLDCSLNVDNCGINDYIDILKRNYPTFSKEVVILAEYKYQEVKPWQSIDYGHEPNWWNIYNKVKHHRDKIENGKENYKNATQKNVLEALCGLYVLIEYWAAKKFTYKASEQYDTTMLKFESSQLKMKNWNFRCGFMGQTWFDWDGFTKYIKGEDSSEHI